MKRILFFDVDGTLVRSVFKGETAPIIKSIELAVGQKISRKGLVFSGGTAKQIVGDLLMANNIPIENNPKIYEIPEIFNQVMKEALEDGSLTYEALPGVNQLLSKLSKSDDFQLALVTGNPVSVANMKLKAAGIDPDLFSIEYEGEKLLIGGFGDDDAYRPGMVKAAILRFENIYGQIIDPSDFLIIGDTPKDIWCGHENNVPALGVATGIFDVKELEKIADATLEDFSNVDKTIEILRNCQRIERECFNYDIQPSREPEQEPI